MERLSHPSVCMYVLLVLSITGCCCTEVVSGSCCGCSTKRQLLEYVGILAPQCTPAVPSVITATPSGVITDIIRPHDVLAYGNNVFVSRYQDEGAVFRYDQDGAFKAVYNVSGRVNYQSIHNQNLYITTDGVDTVFVKSLCIEDEPFRPLIELGYHPNAFEFSPDGEQILIATRGVINIYDTNFTLVSNIPFSDLFSGRVRNMQFDDDENLYISTWTSEIHVFDRNYQFSHTVNFNESTRIDGFVFQCDGSKVLADRDGKVIFVDKSDNVVSVVSQPFIDVIHVAATENGGLFIVDTDADKVYVYRNT